MFIQKFLDHGQFAGILTLMYGIDVLDKMISPLYDDSEGNNTHDFNVFIYVNEIDRHTYE